MACYVLKICLFVYDQAKFNNKSAISNLKNEINCGNV